MKSPDVTAAFDLTGQTALITGGGTGLGFGVAQCLVAAGARAVLVGRREAELKSACAKLGPAAVAVPGDVTRTSGAQDLVARASDAAAGAITILINNAGVHLKKAATATTDEEFAAVLQTHVAGAFALTREVARGMLERRQGTILFTASMTALIGMPLVVAYSAAKSAYGGMVRALASEFGPQGVRVNAIVPGWIGSDMLEQALGGDPTRKARVLARTPLGRFGDSEDIGWAAVYLCSPAGKFVSGVMLPVDGGAAIGF